MAGDETEHERLTQAERFNRMRVVWQLDLNLGPMLAHRKVGVGDGKWMYAAAADGGIETVLNTKPLSDLDVSRLISEDARRTARRLTLEAEQTEQEIAVTDADADDDVEDAAADEKAARRPRDASMIRSAARHDMLSKMGCEISKSRRACGHVDTAIRTPCGRHFRSYVSAVTYMQSRRAK